ncbi:MAG: hypothetical protein IRY91_13130, partial [Gemmatimonadaceae bacterium]|nr:hypothetical protein [Gemmatimonadaceae bacterium]
MRHSLALLPALLALAAVPAAPAAAQSGAPQPATPIDWAALTDETVHTLAD